MTNLSPDTLVYMPGGRAPVWVQGPVQFVLAMRILGFRGAFCWIVRSAELIERVGWRTVMVRGERPRQGSGMAETVTVTMRVAFSVWPPAPGLVTVTVMAAVPGATPVTVAVEPMPLTVAILVALEAYEMEKLEAGSDS